MAHKPLFFNLNSFKAHRLRLLLPLFVVTGLGFASKYYSGPGAWWFNNYVGGLFYEVFWCLIVTFFYPKGKPFWIALGVLALTCFLEFIQLWHPLFLEGIRRTFIGRTLIGTSFSGWDFVYYVIGCGIGWLWLRQLNRATASLPKK